MWFMLSASGIVITDCVSEIGWKSVCTWNKSNSESIINIRLYYSLTKRPETITPNIAIVLSLKFNLILTPAKFIQTVQISRKFKILEGALSTLNSMPH